MRKFFWLVMAAVTLHVGVARAELVTRRTGETDDAFVARVLGPSAELAQKVVRLTELVPGTTTLIGFVTVENQPLVGHVLVQATNDRYEHVHFESCDIEGDTPQLLAVFFARTAPGGPRDLAVLCSWDVRHAVANGTLYGAQFYRVRRTGSDVTVHPLNDVDEKFKTQDVSREGEHGKTLRDKATFKTVADVKRMLTKMGVKQ